MFDLYESTLHILRTDFPAYKQEEEEILRFAAWKILANSTSTPSQALEQYVGELIPGEGDALKRILSEKEKQEERLRLLLLPDTFWEKIQKNKVNITKDTVKEEQIKEALKDPLYLQSLLGLSLDPKLPLHLHFSYESPKEIRMMYFKERGVFLALGIDLPLSPKEGISKEEKLLFFKALGDDSRLIMFQALLKENLTSTELAEQAGISLSTVNHHIKHLIHAGLVRLDLHSKEGKGATFSANKEVYHGILKELQDEVW